MDHDNITSVVKLFDLADKCAKAEEGCLFVKNEPGDPAEGSKKKKSSTEVMEVRTPNETMTLH